MPTKAERDKTVRLANTMIRDMLRDTFDAETVTALAKHTAFLDVMTGSVDWNAAPPEVQARFVKKPTGSDADFEAALEEARKK